MSNDKNEDPKPSNSTSNTNIEDSASSNNSVASESETKFVLIGALPLMPPVDAESEAIDDPILSTSKSAAFYDHLPVDILRRIFSSDLLIRHWRNSVQIALVCKNWKAVVDEDWLWKLYYQNRWNDSNDTGDSVLALSSFSLDISERNSNQWKSAFRIRHLRSCYICDLKPSAPGAFDSLNQPMCADCYRDRALIIRDYDV
mmetsp:Transcript_22073/g.38123  ORF Transcript_22073/g.38123 Transcript_22073/m.38123 type:complete len:201 (+) Transcript_22073:55-657(+)